MKSDIAKQINCYVPTLKKITIHLNKMLNKNNYDNKSFLIITIIQLCVGLK